MITITRIKMTSYRGIKDLEVQVPAGGLIAKGRNGSGKTSVLNGIGAALAATDIGPDAVRIGEDSGEILVDLDAAGRALHVRRRFGEKGSTLSVTTEDGDKKLKPTQVLGDLLGTAPIDVIEVVLEKDAKRRKELILRALPVRADLDFLRRYVPQLPENYDTSGHGLEVIERLRKAAYDKRTEANKAAKEARSEAQRLATVAKTKREQTPDGAPDIAAARASLETAERAMREVEGRQQAARIAREQSARLRAQVDRLRAEAREEIKGAPARPDDAMHAAAVHRLRDARQEVEDLERRLEAARTTVTLASGEVTVLESERADHDRRQARAKECEAQAAEIERGIEDASATVSDEEVARVSNARSAATAQHEAAARRVEAEACEGIATDAAEKAAELEAEAERLDKVVTRLTKEAPAELLKSAGGVASGLDLSGDDVALNGVYLDKLCGAEQMRFAAEIAKALNPNVGFIVVDGLERLDQDQLDAFVEAATEGGRQLFGSLVHRGDLVLAHIDHVRPEAAE